MSSTNIQPTREEKRAKLVDLGLMQFLDGEWCFSAKAVSMLSDVSEDRINENVPDMPAGELRNVSFGGGLLRDMRRGARGVMAAAGSDDPIDVLYWRAVASK